MPSYSDAFKTECIIRLSVNKYDYKLTSEQCGVQVRTLRNWEKSFPKKGVPELLERAIERMLMVIPSDMKASDWAIALGILMDKWLLLEGKPTERTENLLKTFDDLPEDERDNIISEAERIIESLSKGGDNLGS